jgi:type I restriction enzyme R subunit
MNEADTRAELIDPALKAAGWGVVEGSRIRREYLIAPGRIEGKGRRGKPVKADYVLEYRNTKLAGGQVGGSDVLGDHTRPRVSRSPRRPGRCLRGRKRLRTAGPAVPTARNKSGWAPPP